jgi:protein SDA1
MMNLITRLIGIHKLLLLGFYDWVLKYLQPHQKDVTLVLVMVAQSAHELVPPDVMEPVVKVIADRFVEYSRNSPEVLTVGLNSVREICSRCPLAMTEETLRYLTEYKNHKNKGVMNGSRSLIALFREVNPSLLSKKDRVYFKLIVQLCVTYRQVGQGCYHGHERS